MVIAQDRPGYVLNRVVASMINEAVYVNMYGLAQMEDIDQMMRLRPISPWDPLNMPMLWDWIAYSKPWNG